jgi:hypothetical protein
VPDCDVVDAEDEDGAEDVAADPAAISLPLDCPLLVCSLLPA